jgi:translocation and assembly module TamB
MTLRRIIRYFLFAVAGLVLLVAALFGFIQTGPGKRLIADVAGSLASGNGLTVTVAEIDGFVPSRMHIGRLEIADEKGMFAGVEGLDLAWSPLALTSGMISAETLAARKITLLRLPDLKSDPQAQSQSNKPLPRLAIGRLELAEIDISGPVFGQAMQLALSGSARLVDPAEGLALDFALDRRDLPGRIAGKVKFVPDSRVLDIDITADEPANGLIAGLARIEGRPAVGLAVKGKGSLDDFKAMLSFHAGASIQAQGEVGIHRGAGGHAITAGLNGEVAHLLPAKLIPLFEGTTTVDAVLQVDDALRVTINDARLRTVGFGVTLKGTVETRTREAQLHYTIIGGQADRFSGLVPGIQWQDLFVDGSFVGTPEHPEIKAALTLSMPRAGGYGAQMLSATAEVTPQSDGSFALAADGDAKGLEAADPRVKAVLGNTLDFAVTGALGSDSKPILTAATIKLAPLVAEFAGQAAPDAVKGKLRLGRLGLAALSPIAGRALSGQISAEANLDITHKLMRVAGHGSSIGVVTGIAALDGLLKGPAELSGSVMRGADGIIVVEDAGLKAKDASLAVGGRIDRAIADLNAKLTLANLALIDPRMSGAVNATAFFSGTLDKLNLTSRLMVPSGRAMGKPVENLAITVNAADLTGQLSGDLAIDGHVAGKSAQGMVRFAALADNTYRLDPIDLSVGANEVKGTLERSGSGLIAGSLAIMADNLADLSALALTQMSGTLSANVALVADQGKQSISIKAKASGLQVARQAIGKAAIDGAVRDAFGVPMFDGTVDIADMNAGGVAVDRAKLVASGSQTDSALRFDGVVAGTAIAAEGRTQTKGTVTSLDLRALSLAKNGVRAALASPANFQVNGGDVAIDNFVLVAGKGRAAISGTAGKDRMALDVKLTSLPLSLARLGGYDEDLRGELNGTVKIAGKSQSPDGRYDVKISGLSNPDIQRGGAGPFDIALQGDLKGGGVGLAMTIKNPKLQDAQVTGSIAINTQTFDLRSRGGVDLTVANAFLAASGNRLSGRALIDATVRGKFEAPIIKGTVRLADVRFDDVVNGVTMINGDIAGEGRSLLLQNIRGRTQNGGTVTLSGRVNVDSAAGVPLDIDVTFDNAALVTSETARLIADGRVKASGPVLTRPKISGRVDVKKLDINLPDKLSGAAKPIEVRHVKAPPGKKLAGAKPPAAKKDQERLASPGFVADLDVTLSAPNGIFVRGMGVEAELGGDLAVRGTSAEPRSLGGFEIKRGRFDGFGKQLDFEKGLITFNGSLDPELDFVAQTESDGITAKVLITGPASEPKIGFASTPQLPQDEVIARLLFNKGAGELTIGQAAQLAQTIAQLSGSGPGMVDKVRKSLGVDSLDVGTENGGQVGMGKRINDRVYMGVKQGAQPNSSKVTIDVDITKNIRAQGATGADGSTEVGIGAEWDY